MGFGIGNATTRNLLCGLFGLLAAVARRRGNSLSSPLLRGFFIEGSYHNGVLEETGGG